MEPLIVSIVGTTTQGGPAFWFKLMGFKGMNYDLQHGDGKSFYIMRGLGLPAANDADGAQ